MQPTIESLQGELLALRAFIASMLEVMPLASRLQLAGRLERNLVLLRPFQPGEARNGFDRGVEALAVKQRSQFAEAFELGGGERRERHRHN